MKNQFDYIRKTYKVPAGRGVRIEMDGQPGRVLSTTGPHLRVRFDSGRRGICHPTWRMKYFAKDGQLLKETGD